MVVGADCQSSENLLLCCWAPGFKLILFLLPICLAAEFRLRQLCRLWVVSVPVVSVGSVASFGRVRVPLEKIRKVAG